MTFQIHAAACDTSSRSRGNYLLRRRRRARQERSLVTGGDDPLLPHIVSQLAAADRADIVVSFALESGVDRVFEHFRDLLARGGRSAS